MSREILGPVEPTARIGEVDIVRGFALFGVLLVNMYGFGADSIAWDSTANKTAFAITRVLFESKSWTLFSILFGIGFALQLQSAEARGGRILPMYLRRLTVLFAIGAAHALLFDGDILMLYAELGLGFLVVNRVPARWLLVLAVGLLLVFPLVHLSKADRHLPEPDDAERVEDAQHRLELEQRYHVYSIGSPADVVAYNASAIPADPLEDVDKPESGLAVFAMFLVGLLIGRSDILRDIPGHAALIARVRTWGLGFGLVAMGVEHMLATTCGYAVYRQNYANQFVTFAGDLLFAFGTVALAFGYAAALVLAAQAPRGKAVLAPLAAVGRLALTVYLTQTLVFTTLFYGYGFGQAYRLGPVAVTAWAVAIFTVQVVACQWWSKRFRFGPVEWLWRCLTYLEWQPLRRET